MVDAVVDSLPSEASCVVEKVRVLEAKEIGTLKSGAGIVAEKLENGRSSRDQDDDFGPVIPILDGEKSELSSLFNHMDDDDLGIDCQTPTESIFDPFAPGPDDLVFAPKKKTMKETKIPLRRQLNFELDCDPTQDVEMDVDEDDDDEKLLFESICKSFLDLVISSQLREMSPEDLSADSHLSKVFKTPTSISFFTGIAETCPAAPMRPSCSKSRKPSGSLCRKLEFETNLI